MHWHSMPEPQMRQVDDSDGVRRTNYPGCRGSARVLCSCALLGSHAMSESCMATSRQYTFVLPGPAPDQWDQRATAGGTFLRGVGWATDLRQNHPTGRPARAAMGCIHAFTPSPACTHATRDPSASITDRRDKKPITTN
jgi:hypothetical protein